MKDSINLKTFKIHYNHVLIKPDDHLTTFQKGGRDLGILCSDFKYEDGKTLNVKERNASVNGTVYAVPEKLLFQLNEIRTLKSRYTTHRLVDKQLQLVNLSVQREIDNLFANSCQFDTEVEVKVGDRVNFSYMAHQKAYEEFKVLETDEGTMYLVKYDLLYMTLDENDKPKKLLNGFLMVEPDMIETQKEGASEFTTTESGLVLPTMGHKFKKSKKNQIGTIIKFGTRNKGYLQRPELTDCHDKLEEGQKIVYDPRLAMRMEYENHQIMSDKITHLIQRPHIYFMIEKGFDVSKLRFEKRRMANV